MLRASSRSSVIPGKSLSNGRFQARVGLAADSRRGSPVVGQSLIRLIPQRFWPFDQQRNQEPQSLTSRFERFLAAIQLQEDEAQIAEAQGEPGLIERRLDC